MIAIPVSKAYVCVECQIVMDTPQVCPQCASGQGIASLARWLGWRGLLSELDARSAVRAGR